MGIVAPAVGRNIRFVTLLVLFCTLMVPLAAWGINVPEQAGSPYVQDFAGVLSGETKAKLIARGQQLNNDTTAQVVVVTIPSLEGATVEDYAKEVYREYGIGDSQENNGVLFLVAMKERKFRIEMGYGVEGPIPKIEADRIRDQVTEFFKKGDYNGGIAAGYEALAVEVTKGNSGNQVSQKSSEGMFPFAIFGFVSFGFLIFPIIFIVIIVLIVKRAGRRGRYGSDHLYDSGTGNYFYSDSSWSSGDSGSGSGSSGDSGSSGSW